MSGLARRGEARSTPLRRHGVFASRSAKGTGPPVLLRSSRAPLRVRRRRSWLARGREADAAAMPSRRAQVDHFCAAFAPRGWQATSEGCWATLAYDGARPAGLPVGERSPRSGSLRPARISQVGPCGELVFWQVPAVTWQYWLRSTNLRRLGPSARADGSLPHVVHRWRSSPARMRPGRVLQVTAADQEPR